MLHRLTVLTKYTLSDEVHMLTLYSFNALLKLLEEPPKHVIFILATTDVHRLPDTIVSRTQRYNFNSVSNEDLIKQLSEIAKKEKININKQALEVIADHGNGSFRDSITILDQLQGFKKIEATDVYRIMGTPNSEIIENFVKNLQNSNDLQSTAQQIDDLYSKGYQAGGIADSLHLVIKNKIIEGDISNKLNFIKLMHQLVNVKGSSNPKRLLEIILLNFTASNLQNNTYETKK
jgi:DNA polymerase-3 subunit gamma/tau